MMCAITALTAEFAACGCAIDFHKTCSCPKAESMNVVFCPLHAAAPDLLAALKAISVRCDEAADHGHIWADTVIRIGRIVDVATAKAEEGS